MALTRVLAKPIQSRLESIVLQSAFYVLALASLLKIYDYIPFKFSKQAELLLPIVRTILNVLWSLAVAKRLSGVVSHVALNSWKGNVWSDDEIVVVTGGSSGIGAMVSLGFAEKGAKVAIMDLHESKEKLGKLRLSKLNVGLINTQVRMYPSTNAMCHPHLISKKPRPRFEKNLVNLQC
jgi:hypothetical protein